MSKDNLYSPPQTEVLLQPAALFDNDIQDFTGSEYYVRKWRKHLEGKSIFAGFNWPAALFGALWGLYRRMYWFAAAIALAGFALAFIVSLVLSLFYIELDGTWQGSALIVTTAFSVRIVGGFMANILYLKRAQQAAANIAATASVAERSEQFKSAGGLNETAMWIGLVCSVLFNIATRVLLGT